MKIDAVFYLSVHFQMSFSFINEKLISIVLLNLLSAEFQRDLNWLFLYCKLSLSESILRKTFQVT